MTHSLRGVNSGNLHINSGVGGLKNYGITLKEADLDNFKEPGAVAYSGSLGSFAWGFGLIRIYHGGNYSEQRTWFNIGGKRKVLSRFMPESGTWEEWVEE